MVPITQAAISQWPSLRKGLAVKTGAGAKLKEEGGPRHCLHRRYRFSLPGIGKTKPNLSAFTKGHSVFCLAAVGDACAEVASLGILGG
jgi:hypothetical protein